MDDQHGRDSRRRAPDPNIRSGCCFGCFASIILIVLSVASFHGGGWQIAWGAARAGRGPFALGASEILIRVNKGYYGIVQTDRFFDSPALSWILLALAVVFIFSSPGALIVKTKRMTRGNR